VGSRWWPNGWEEGINLGGGGGNMISGKSVQVGRLLTTYNRITRNNRITSYIIYNNNNNNLKTNYIYIQPS
jgi:hypothetical protein